MPRYIFPASTVTNTTGAAVPLTFHVTSTTGRRETDLWTVSGSDLLERIPNGVVLADVTTGAYSAFAGPDDVDTLYVSVNGGSRTAITATSLVTGQGGTYLNSTYSKVWTSPAASATLTGTLAAWVITAVDCTAGAGARTLPAASSVTAGVAACAKKADTSANTLVVSRAGSDLIYGTGAGSTSKTLSLAGEAVEFVSNGIDKWTIRSSDTPSGVLASTYLTQATAATTYAPIGLSIGNLVVATGDSITAASVDNANNLFDTSWHTYFVALSGGRSPYLYNAGHSGYTSTQLVALLSSEVLAKFPSGGSAQVIIAWGRNDSPTLATTIANDKAAVAAVRAAGGRPVLTTLPPLGTTALSTPAAPTGAASTTGGTLTTATYTYTVVAKNGNGATLPSSGTGVAVTGPTGKVVLTWSYQTGVSSYDVYRDNLKIGNAGGNGTTLTFTDTGTVGSGAAPVSNTTGNTKLTADITFTAQVNAWRKRYGARNGIKVIDFYSVLVDPQTGLYKQGYTLDGTHPTPIAARLMGQSAATALASDLPSTYGYVATDNADPTNVYNNGLFYTLAGSGQQRPTGWTNPSTGSTSSVGTVTGFAGQAWTIQRTDATAASYVGQADLSTGWSVGDTLQFSCVAQCTGNDATGLVAEYVAQFLNASASPGQLAKWRFYSDLASPTLLVGPEAVVPTGTTIVRLYHTVYGGTGTSIAGQYTVRNLTTGGILA